MTEEPIKSQYVTFLMNELARRIDAIFNGDDAEKNIGFVLLVFPFNEVTGKGRTNYISNADRKSTIIMLKALIARFEGQPEAVGHG